MSQIAPDRIVKYIRNKNKYKYGILCINCLFIKCKIEDISEFIEKYKVSIPSKDAYTRLEYLRYILIHFTNIYNTTEIKNKWKTPLEYISDIVLKDKIFERYHKDLDFIAKQDLIDVFADFCADLDITVYQVNNLNKSNKNFEIDLYLTKKKPMLRTESVILRTGSQMNEEDYNDILKLLKIASKSAIWTVFVTTPIGAKKIGIQRLIEDMESLKVWLYVVDPGREKILGITKGKKTDLYEEEQRDKFIDRLPREPIRAASQVVQISDYEFIESESYKSSDFGEYELLDEVEHNKLILKPQSNPRYTDIFQDLIIIDEASGTLIFSYTSENFKDQTLASGFLSAMDTFISQIGGSTMQEINYKGFYVQGAHGMYTKLVCFLSEKANQSLKERLAFLIDLFEARYKKEIAEYRNSGDVDLLNEEEIQSLIREILDL